MKERRRAPVRLLILLRMSESRQTGIHDFGSGNAVIAGSMQKKPPLYDLNRSIPFKYLIYRPSRYARTVAHVNRH